MTVSQTITVRNPPAREYVARATMPFPTGTDPRLLGNSLGARQQYRLFAKTKEWDVYEWCALLPSGSSSIEISDSYSPVPSKAARARIGGNVTIPGSSRPFEGLVLGIAPQLLTPDTFQLIFDGPDGKETVNISGVGGKAIRAGPLKVTFRGHVRTQHYGSFHYYWDVTRNDPMFRLTINLHTGIPAPEVLLSSIRLKWPGPVFHWIAELDDPAFDSGQGYILKPLADTTKYYLFPRMAQRCFRILFYPASQTQVPTAAQRQDPGWGVANWSAGGFLATALKAPPTMLSHVTNLYPNVVSEALSDNANLGALFNSIDGYGGTPPTTALWPAVGQQYGGPTGSDGKYKPYNGILALMANAREGLIKHKVEQLRHHSRDWTVIYEDNGAPVIPENHLENGAATWDCYTAGSQFFKGESGGWHPYDVLWKDGSFGFDQFREKRLPSQRAELQTYGGFQRWDNWDQQHRMLTWAGDMALAWVDADPVSIMYLVGEAEKSRMVYWAGSGGTFAPPASEALGVGWGRDVQWSMYCIACALAFVQADTPDTDDDGNPLTPSNRRGRWAGQELAAYIEGTEKAMMPIGTAWYGSTDPGSKGFTDAPFGDGGTVGNYYLLQLFEGGYGINALHAALGVMGNNWRSLLGPAQIDIRRVSLQFARMCETGSWAGTQTVASAAVAAGQGGSGYSVGDIVVLVDDRLRANTNFITNPTPARFRVDTVDGAGAVTALSVNNAGLYFNQPTTHNWDGIPGALAACYVESGTVAAGGSGYQALNGATVAVGGGVSVNNSPATFRLTVVNGVVTAVQLQTVGKYIVPPPSPAPIPGGNGNATVNLGRTCVGKNLRVTLTWTAPAVAAPGTANGGLSWKFLPVGPYPGSTRYTSRADFVPLDICGRSALDNPYITNVSGAGQQDLLTVSLENLLGLWGYGAEEAGEEGGYSLIVAKRIAVATTKDAILAAIKANGMGRWHGQMIENWWPALSYYGQPDVP